MAVGGMGIGATDGRPRGKDGRSWSREGVGRGVSGEGGGVKGKQGESVSGVDGRKRSGAADRRTGSAEQEVLTGEGTSTGARRETREEGQEGCTQRALRGLGWEEEGRARMFRHEVEGRARVRERRESEMSSAA